jgi:hypothetical protein
MDRALSRFTFVVILGGCGSTLQNSLDRWYGTESNQKFSEVMLARAHRFVPSAEADLASLLQESDSSTAAKNSVSCVDSFVRASTWFQADAQQIPQSELSKYVTTGGPIAYPSGDALVRAKKELKDCADACGRSESIRDLNPRYRQLCSTLEPRVKSALVARQTALEAAQRPADVPPAPPSPAPTPPAASSSVPESDGGDVGVTAGEGFGTGGLGLCSQKAGRPSARPFHVSIDGVRTAEGSADKKVVLRLNWNGMRLPCDCAGALQTVAAPAVVTVALTIDPKGGVTSVKDTANAGKSALAQCTLAAIKKWTFAKSDRATTVEATIHFAPPASSGPKSD